MARREVNIFNVSFLDCIFCGFGAVVLLFIIINARAVSERVEESDTLEADVDKIEQEVLKNRKNLILVRNALEVTDQELVLTKGMSSRIEKELEEKKIELAEYENRTVSKTEHVNRLKSDVKSLEEDFKRLKAAVLAAEGGTHVKSFAGDGDRQYLTGVKVGGKRILILVDSSASMLGRQIVDVIIRRNLPDASKRQSPKWQKAISTVDWITAQLPAGSRFQLVTFNEKAMPVLPGSSGDWLDASDPVVLGEAMDALREIVPAHGTSLHAAFGAIQHLQPRPDNVFLLVDGLPTLGERKTSAKKVSGNTRLKYYRSAISGLPRNVPLNVILFPMEGDPMAATSYWRLAVSSRGSFFSPSEDWP
jgi:hypothetical protein